LQVLAKYRGLINRGIVQYGVVWTDLLPSWQL
jgi:hypothetical protein